MKTLRIIGAAFLVLLGAMVLVGWSVAGKAVGSIESGEAATKLTQKLLDDPDFADAAAGRITDRLVDRTDGNFVGRIVSAFAPEIQQAIANVLQSDQVNEAVTQSVSKVEKQLTDELTEPNRASAPFVISIDLSDRVNARIDQIPVIGGLLPSVTVPPIERELIDAQTFDSVRQVYSGLKLVATWGLLAGVLLIIAGFFVAPRRRWYWPQAVLGVAVLVLAVSIVIRRIIPSAIAGSVPGGENGGAGTFLQDFISDNATGPIASRLLAMAVWAFVLALLFAAIARFLPTLKEQYLPTKVVVVTPATFVAPVGVPDAVVAETATAASTVVAQEAAGDATAVEEVVVAESPEPSATETMVVASPISSPATAPAEATAVAAVPVVAATTPSVGKTTAKAPAAKATPAKAPVTKAPAAKATPAKAPVTKAPAAKVTPAKAPAASDEPKPKATRTRKPAPPKE